MMNVVGLATAIGSGMTLFTSLAEPMKLELVDLKRFPLGAVAHVYRKAV
jgi:hypothetical protein